jgi:hypothetical protein
MKRQKVGIFEDEDRKAHTRYFSAPGADMDRRAVIDIFLVVADGWFA